MHCSFNVSISSPQRMSGGITQLILEIRQFMPDFLHAVGRVLSDRSVGKTVRIHTKLSLDE